MAQYKELNLFIYDGNIWASGVEHTQKGGHAVETGAISGSDPVTGSIHSALVPYWANRLQKSKIHAYQASQRRGDLFCEYLGERVLIGGQAVKYLTGTIYI